MPADDEYRAPANTTEHNRTGSTLPDAAKRCGACGGVWYAIGFKSVLANSCLFCGARLTDTKETAE